MGKEALWLGTASVKGSNEFTRMVLLTTCLLGLQLCWGLEMTYGVPHLLSLGLSKQGSSLVWIAGPLSGILTAPSVGAIADHSKSFYGRRRPFMVYGSIAVCICFYALGWSKEIVQWVLSVFGHSGVEAEQRNRHLTIALAVVSIYVVDFAINVVQWSSRSLIVDTLPASKQQMGSAWAGRMSAFGHIIGYAVGSMDLHVVFGDLIGDTQFKRMTVISGLSLTAGVAVTCWATTEKILISDGDGAKHSRTPRGIFRKIFDAILTMPPRIQAICRIQFCAWVGWFPFLFYGAEWVGEIYFRLETPAHAKAAIDRAGEVGRIGSSALMAFSTVTFLAMLFLPSMIRSPDEDSRKSAFPAKALPVFGTGVEKKTKHDKRRMPGLLTAWYWSHLLFGGAMVFAPFVRSVRFAATLVAFCGIPWALTSWAPFTFMGVEINKMSREANASSLRRRSNSVDLEKSEGDGATGGALAGIYLGILNVFTAGPQLFASLLSMAVFSALEPREAASQTAVDDGPNAIGVCLFLGAWAAFGAAYMARQLRRLEQGQEIKTM